MRKILLALLLILAASLSPKAQINRARMYSGTNVQTGTTYLLSPTDTTKLTIFKSSSAVVATIPSAASQGFTAGYVFSVKNMGSANVTLLPVGSTIDGKPSILLFPGQSLDLLSDGADYTSMQGGASGGLLPTIALTSTPTPIVDGTINVSYFMSLTANVTSITVLGTPVNGNTLRLAFKQDATGGRTVVFPGNFVFPLDFALRVQPLSENNMLFLNDGTNWHLVENIPDGALDYYPAPSFTATPTFANSRSAAFDFTLTGNVTSSSFTTTGRAGTQFILNLCQDAVGGRTFSFPANTSNPQGFTFDTTATHCNRIAYYWTTTTWIGFSGGSGGGGGSPGGNSGDLQINSGGFGAGGENDNGTRLAIDRDVNPKGPNPSFDIMRYGGYFEPSNAPVTSVCSITASSTTLSCVSNSSFQNGHGIVIPKAGLLPLTRNGSFPSAPTVGTVTPIGVSNGSTTYSYQFVLEDYFGGLTAAGTAGTTTSGAATLGVNIVSLTAMTRVSGLDTFTCSANCNLMTNAQVQIAGATGGGNSTVNGTVVVNSIVDPTHFTVLANGMPDYSESFSGTLSVKACNELFPSGLLAQESVILRTWIYRGGTLVGVSPGQDPFYIDCGQGVSGQPAYVPTSAPGAAQAGYLATTISSGGGTTTMTLAASAGTTATSQTVQHSNDAALIAAYTAALASHGGVVRIPVIPAGGVNTFPFNATTNLTTVSNPTNATVRLELASVTVNQPWILPNFFAMGGIPQVSTSFGYSPLGSISGSAHPFVLGTQTTGSNGVQLSRLKFAAGFTGQSSIVLDETLSPGGVVGWVFNDVALSGSKASALVIKGGFDFWFNQGTCSVLSEVATWTSHPCIYLTNASTYLGSTTQVPGRVYIDHYNFGGGTGVQLDNAPLSNQLGTFTSGGGDIFLNKILHESNAGPTLRVALGLSTTSALGIVFVLDGVQLADQANGAHQPLLELTGNANVRNITVRNSQGAAFEPTILGGGIGAAPLCINNIFTQGCGPTPNQNINGVNSINDGGVIGSTNGGSIGYLMSTPAAPASCVVSAGGSVPVGSFTYAIIAVDRNNISYTPYQGLTLLGPTCSVTTTGGNQTVTVTRPTLPAGAVGWLPWRGGGLAQLPNCAIPIPASTTTYVDTFAVTCGVSAPQASTAFTAGINSGGSNANHFYGGAYSGAQVLKTGNFTFATTDFDVIGDPTGGAFTGTLPHATAGQVWKITNKTAGANLITIQPDSGTILTPSGAASSVTLASGVSDEFTCDGTTCYLKSSNSGGSTNVVNCNQFGIAFYSGVGVANTINCFGPPVVAGTFIPVWSNSSPGATTPQVGQLGSPVNSQSGNYLATNLDRAASVRFSTGSTAILTLPAIAFPFGSNFSFQAPNYNSGNLTITPTTQTINGGANLTVLPGWRADVKSDLSPAWFADLIPTFNAFTGSCPAITFNSSTGFPCATLFYQLIGNNGTSQTARNRINFIPGTGTTFSFADNPGTGSTDMTINSSGGGLPDPAGNGYVVRTALNTTVARTFTASGPIVLTNPDGVAGNTNVNSIINVCGTFPAAGAYTPSGTANTRECLGAGTYTLPTSVTTLSNAGFVIYCAPGTLLQRGSGASGLKFTGNLSGFDSCLSDDGGFTSTARFIEITGNDDFVKNSIFQNHSATSSALPTIDITGSATRAYIFNNTFLGTQVDPCISINSASTASGTIQGTIIESNRVAAFGPSAATGCITSNQVSGSTVTDTTIIKNKITQTTSGATGIQVNGQAAVQNAAYKGWVVNNNQITQTTTGGASAIKLFGTYNGQAIGNLIDLNGHAVSQSAMNLGDFYDFIVDVVIHGGGNENDVNCVDCENNRFHFVVDSAGGGLNCFTGSSSQNPFSHNIISGVCRMSANAIGVTIKGNASGKPANYNKIGPLSVHCNGNASSTGTLFDIGNSSTGLNNSISNATFDGCSGASSVDINVNNSAMTGTIIGPGISYDSGDTKSLNDSGTTTQFADTNLRTTLNSSYTNATTTFSSVTGLAFPIAASQTLTAKCTIIWQGSAATTGPKYQFTGPASPTSVAASAYSAVTATTYTQATATAFSSSMANTGTITTATNFVDTVTIGVLNGTTSGTVQLQAAANGTGTLTIQPGSYCTIQ